MFPAMLRTSMQSWGPEEEAVVKTSEEPQDDVLPTDTLAGDAHAAADFVAVRVARSQSLTDPKTPPMFASPTHSNNSSSGGFSSSETDAPALTQPQSEPRLESPQPPLVSPEQLASDPRFARRNRRSMSAEFTLSMLQQELGYPKRKSSKASGASRRGSVAEKSRRTSSIIEEESLDTSNNNSSSEDGIESLSAEPEPERPGSRHSIDSASKFKSRSKRGSYSSNQEESHDDTEIEDDEDDNFLASRVASITGFSQDTDGVVYYEILVKSVAHGPLSAYKVRRRYSEFRDLHRTLSRVMPTSRSATLTTGPLGSGDDDEQHEASSTASMAQARVAAHLPPLPDRGGLWAYLQFDTTPFLERRAKYFQALLVASQHDPRARESRLLNDFLGPPPDLVALHTSVENSYVSLNRFAAPKLRLSVEAQERKQKATNISRRRSSIHRVSRPAESESL